MVYDNKLCIYDKKSNSLKRVDFTIKIDFMVEFRPTDDTYSYNIINIIYFTISFLF